MTISVDGNRLRRAELVVIVIPDRGRNILGSWCEICQRCAYDISRSVVERKGDRVRRLRLKRSGAFRMPTREYRKSPD